MLILAFVMASCAGLPGTVFTATEDASAFLEQTAVELFPTRSFETEVGSPDSTFCLGFGGVTDKTRWATTQTLVFDLEPGDDPITMASQVVDYWRSLGYAVEATGWGTHSVAGEARARDGYWPGFRGADHGDSEDDDLALLAITECYLRP